MLNANSSDSFARGQGSLDMLIKKDIFYGIRGKGIGSGKSTPSKKVTRSSRNASI